MQRKALLLFMFMAPCSVWSAPALQMHVFEENEPEDIKTHVFTNTRSYSPAPSHAATTDPSLTFQTANVYFRTGYRQDTLIWNIGTNGGLPNIISELKWENIEIATLNFGASFYVTPQWLLNIDAVYGRVFDGDNQDSDYYGNNRTLEFSRSNNNADEGDVYDISVSAAYKIPFNEYIEFQPAIGLSYHAQNFKMTDGYQTVSDFGFGVPLGPFSGLNNTYDSTWFGPWMGWAAIFKPSNQLKFSLDLEYHYVDYDATANWNLRTDFAHPESFTTETNAYGLIGRLEGIYQYSPSLSFDLAVNYQHWSSNEPGKIKFFYPDSTSSTQPFNEVKWRSYGISLGLNYDF
jgi:hypothetical protein